MASPYYTPPAIEDTQEVYTENEIYFYIQRLLSQIRTSPGELRFSDLEYDEDIGRFIEKLDGILSELQKISNILQGYFDSHSYVGNYMIGDPKEILEQVKTCQIILESYFPKLNRIRGNSEKIYMILIQLVLEGVQVPQMEDFRRVPLQMSITNIVRAVQENDTTHPVGIVVENIVKIIIGSLGERFAECKYYHRLLDSAASIIVRIGTTICTLTYHHFEFHKDACNKISEFKREFAACGIRENLERISRYLDTAVTNSQSDVLAGVKQSLCLVWESVKSYKQNYPHKCGSEILNELSRLPACSGLVLPIVTKVQCSSQDAWEIVIQLFSSLRNPALLEL